MSKHTPGPWQWNQNKNDQCVELVARYTEILAPQIRIEAVDGKISAGVGSCEGNWEANACLIAAAPKLLEACKAVTTLFQPRPGLPPDVAEQFRHTVEKDPVLRQVRAAIAEAEGGDS